MQAIRVAKAGGPEVLKIETVPIPVPAKDEVLVQVKAVGINPCEAYIRSGAWAEKEAAAGRPDAQKFPYTPGSDAAGVVTALGADVKDFKVGDGVFVSDFLDGCSGAYAQYMTAVAKRVFHLPAHLTFSQGASLGIPYFTVLKALKNKAQAKKGENILIHGASGGVGIAAVQLAKALEMDVVGTASTDEGAKLVKANGARIVLNHHDKDHKKNLLEASGGEGFNVIIEMLANVNLALDLEVAKIGGRIVVVGSRGKIEIDPEAFVVREAAVFGDALYLSSDADWKEMAEYFDAIMRSSKLINPIIDLELPLEQAPQAHKQIMEHVGGSKGKIILIP